MRCRRVVLASVGVLLTLPATAAAHGSSIRGGREALAIPTWLFLATGGAVVGASFLLTSLVTDRGFVRRLHQARAPLGLPTRPLRYAGGILGLLGLILLGTGGVFGVSDPLRNPAIVLVWILWWPGVTMVTYLVGNVWPALNPLRTVSRVVPTRGMALPESVGVWLAAVGVLGIIFLEVVSPLATDPLLLTGAVLGYLAVGLLGVLAFGETWFHRIDPVSNVFSLYGRLAPTRSQRAALVVALPGSDLVDGVDRVPGGAALVLAILWGTTYDGLVTTTVFERVGRPVVNAGVPPRILYLGVLLAGFTVFLVAYRMAIRGMRTLGPTFRRSGGLEADFAASLVPIAAGYHLAHYLGDLLALSPSVFGVLANPLSPPPVTVLTLPGWFDVVPIGAVLGGHLIAIAVAHAVAYETFPGRLQAIRAQVPLTVLMIGYTVLSLWIVSRPTSPPPFL